MEDAKEQSAVYLLNDRKEERPSNLLVKLVAGLALVVSVTSAIYVAVKCSTNHTSDSAEPSQTTPHPFASNSSIGAVSKLGASGSGSYWGPLIGYKAIGGNPAFYTRLYSGYSLYSADYNVWVSMQSDCNLVVYRSNYNGGRDVLWASNTVGQGNGQLCNLVLGPENGVLGIYRGTDNSLVKTLWTNPNGNNDDYYYLVMQSDGNFVLYAQGKFPSNAVLGFNNNPSAARWATYGSLSSRNYPSFNPNLFYTFWLENSANWRWNLYGNHQDPGSTIGEWWSPPGGDVNSNMYVYPGSNGYKLPTGEPVYFVTPANTEAACLAKTAAITFASVLALGAVIFLGAESTVVIPATSTILGTLSAGGGAIYGLIDSVQVAANGCNANCISTTRNSGYLTMDNGCNNAFVMTCDSCSNGGCANCVVASIQSGGSGAIPSSAGCVKGPNSSGGSDPLFANQGYCDRWGINVQA
ncbi:hypothetical protein HDV06_002441 [Boothiomyces sp. JEL0866]|nr:hypothetical protein HDV06_002441 [Boothiomyces sp. JEL0866]